MLLHYVDYEDADLEQWKWPNFLPGELCSDDGSLKAWPETLDLLEAIREELGGPLIVNSFYRSPKHNARVGGGQKSQHLTGRAADLRATRWGVKRIADIAIANKVRGLGLYRNFVHVDMRSPNQVRRGQEYAFWDYR